MTPAQLQQLLITHAPDVPGITGASPVGIATDRGPAGADPVLLADLTGWLVPLAHVTLLFTAGLLRNLNHIYAIRGDSSWIGFGIFAVTMALLAAAWLAAAPFTLRRPRAVQRAGFALRLRNEVQLGFKQVKWLAGIDFVAHYPEVDGGHGGYNPGHEFFGCRQTIQRRARRALPGPLGRGDVGFCHACQERPRHDPRRCPTSLPLDDLTHCNEGIAYRGIRS